jgi:REP element-mobilizing transposase RayT
MARRQRYIPEPQTLVEVENRTLQGRFLLRPGDPLNERIVAVLARAKKRYGVQIHAATFLSNHYHLLLSVRDARQLARFMGYVDSNIARQASRLYGWTGKFWQGRYSHTVVSKEEGAQLQRLKYVLSQGCKEHLVAKPEDWPGVQSAAALATGTPLTGTWVDRCAEYEAARSGKSFDQGAHSTRYELFFTPLPCWDTLDEEERQKRTRELLVEIGQDARRERALTKTPEPNQRTLRRILRRSIRHRGPRPKRRPAPLIHAVSREIRKKFLELFREFVRAYRAAADRLRRGERDVRFPPGCFPPALPFSELLEA